MEGFVYASDEIAGFDMHLNVAINGLLLILLN
jgi:hypothetical protein